MLFLTALSKTYSTMIIQVKSREKIFKHVVILSFLSSLHVYKNKSSQSYRAIFNSKNVKKLSHSLDIESVNSDFCLLIELNQPKF